MEANQATKKAVERARRRGASAAEAFAEVRRSASVRVRDGEVEALEDATSKGIGLRVIARGRLGFAYTSEFSPAAVEDLVASALAVAQSASADPRNVLPDKPRERESNGAADLYDPAVAELPSQWLIDASREMERAGKAQPRIVAFDSVGAGISVGESVIASSHGFVDAYRGTSAYLYAVPVAGDGNQLQTGYWMDYRRFLSELEPAESIGRKAAERAARMLGARSVPTQRATVVLDPMMAAEFVYGLASAVNGDLAYKKSTFLAGRLGERVADAGVTVIDDGLYPRGVASAPFDGEGVRSQRTTVIDQGVLAHFLYDTLTARKARTRSTGNAARSYASLPTVAPRNVYLAAGTQKPEEIVRGVKNGLYVTAMLGRGLNVVTGEYSRGANGLWIENGELAYPVQAVTVAGEMIAMMTSIDAIGTDLDFRGPAGAPTLRFSELAIGGT